MRVLDWTAHSGRHTLARATLLSAPALFTGIVSAEPYLFAGSFASDDQVQLFNFRQTDGRAPSFQTLGYRANACLYYTPAMTVYDLNPGFHDDQSNGNRTADIASADLAGSDVSAREPATMLVAGCGLAGPMAKVENFLGDRI
jgi:hypothetical protein